MPSRDGPWQRSRSNASGSVPTWPECAPPLTRFAAVAERIGCEWVVIKGIALAEDVYRDARFRFSVDVDVRVDPTAFRDVLEVLQRDGWRLIDRNWPLLLTSRPANSGSSRRRDRCSICTGTC